MLSAEQVERHQLPPILGNELLQHGGARLTAEQAVTVHHVLSSRCRVTGVIGKAGTGKTTTLTTLVEALGKAGIEVFGVAPTTAASEILNESGLQATTVAALLAASSGSKLGRGGVLIVDEAGMLSSKQMRGLLDRAKAGNHRLVLVGDPGQLAAVEAGKPFAQLIAAGLPSSTLKQVHRQRVDDLKRAVEFAGEGRIGEAIATIEHHVREIPGREARLDAVAAAYLGLTPAQRAETIVVAGTRASRERLNKIIRSGLGLSTDELTVRTLERKDLTTELAASISSYEEGDVVRADRDYSSLGLRRGDQATVARVTPTRVVITNERGAEVEWSPALKPGLSAFRVVERSVAVGELIRVTANSHAEGLVNGDQLTVLAIDSEKAKFTAVLPDGEVKEFDLSSPVAIDHAYCRTVYASQGATCERVFIEADTNSLTSHQSTFYVALSRAKSEVLIFTDDADSLAPAMGRSKQKASALEVVVAAPAEVPSLDFC